MKSLFNALHRQLYRPFRVPAGLLLLLVSPSEWRRHSARRTRRHKRRRERGRRGRFLRRRHHGNRRDSGQGLNRQLRRAFTRRDKAVGRIFWRRQETYFLLCVWLGRQQHLAATAARQIHSGLESHQHLISATKRNYRIFRTITQAFLFSLSGVQLQESHVHLSVHADLHTFPRKIDE